MIDLTRAETEVLIQAIEAWEKQPRESGFSAMLLGTILTPKTERDAFKREMDQKAKEMSDSVENRREIAIPILAKLYAHRRWLSEHQLDEQAK